MDEIKKELLLKENSADIIIPNLNGKAPEKVKCINNDVLIEKVEDTGNGQKYRLTVTVNVKTNEFPVTALQKLTFSCFKDHGYCHIYPEIAALISLS